MQCVRKFALFLLTVAAMGTTTVAMQAQTQDVISTVVGNGPNNIPGPNANLNRPYELAADAAGNVYIADPSQNRVYKVSTSNVLTVLAGDGAAGFSGDGGPAAMAELNGPPVLQSTHHRRPMSTSRMEITASSGKSTAVPASSAPLRASPTTAATQATEVQRTKPTCITPTVLRWILEPTTSTLPSFRLGMYAESPAAFPPAKSPSSREAVGAARM